MAQHIQTSFASGELAPKLRSRVDVAKYHSGAALLRNFLVDYSAGGASTRQGTRWVLQCKSLGARLVPFQPASNLSYVLEFGQNYLRFYTNGGPVLETAVTGGTGASGNTFTIANSLSPGDWVLATAWGGMTNVNGNYYIVATASGANFTVTDLFGNTPVFTGTYTSGGQFQRVYTITTPYITSDLFANPATGNPGLKFVQDVTSMIICHPSYPPQILTENSVTNWSLTTINFGTTIPTPTNVAASATGGGTGWYSAWVVTAVDANGQESAPSTPATVSNATFLNDPSHNAAYSVTWNAVVGVVSYNVYRAAQQFGAAVPTGAQYGFVANVTNNAYSESTPGVAPDFAQTPPVAENPFVGAGVQSYIAGIAGSYTTVPGVTVAAPASGVTATALASLGVTVAAVNSGLAVVGAIYFGPNNSVFTGAAGNTLVITNPGGLLGVGNATPSNPVSLTIRGGGALTANLTWGVLSLIPVQDGAGYTSVPAVSFSAGAATATAVLGAASAGNPGVPNFFQERLVLANQPQSVQDFNLSQPGSFFNFNISNPTQDDDAISGSIISEELNDIRGLVPVPTGIMALTGRGAWLINGGGGLSVNNPVTPSNIVASAQAFNGANDLKPVKINFDVLYATNKGNYVRDLSYNIYAAIFSGSDISVWSNHLFFGYFLLDWAWAEEPFKTLWAVRNDGTLLSLAYVKEQELIGWAHHDTNGQFTSVCSVIETVSNGNVVDAVYVIVQRVINSTTVQYVERMADRYFKHGWIDSWSVDCALQTAPNSKPANTLTVTGDVSTVGNAVTLTDTVDAPFTSTMATNSWRVDTDDGGVYVINFFASTSQVGAVVARVPNFYNKYNGNNAFPSVGGLWSIWQPTSTVTGLQQLVGASVIGTADGFPVGPFTVSASGSVTLPAAFSKVTLGLSYTPQLQTLPLEPASQKGTTQGKRKKFPDITLRVADTLGLQVGTSFSTATTVKDFQIGAIQSQSTGPNLVQDLINQSLKPDGQMLDAFVVNDPLWQEIGQLCIQQNLPYPATILGIIPNAVVGDEP